MKKTIEFLHEKKSGRIPITMLTAYDFPTAKFEDTAGIDSILVGDSVGTNVLGYASEQDVTMDDMAHHVRAVARAVESAYLIADLPFNAANDNARAYDNSRRLIDCGAECVKIEGWAEKRSIVEHLVSRGVTVCGHIGYNPQTHGARAQTFGKVAQEALDLIRGADALEQAGLSMIVLEKIRDEVAALITARLRIPTIGIGSGVHCDGQVLVVHDVLGSSGRTFRHARPYTRLAQIIPEAISAYRTDVEQRSFPSDEHVSHMSSQELSELMKQLGTE